MAEKMLSMVMPTATVDFILTNIIAWFMAFRLSSAFEIFFSALFLRSVWMVPVTCSKTCDPQITM
jgi:hypothetical protein